VGTDLYVDATIPGGTVPTVEKHQKNFGKMSKVTLICFPTGIGDTCGPDVAKDRVLDTTFDVPVAQSRASEKSGVVKGKVGLPGSTRGERGEKTY